MTNDLSARFYWKADGRRKVFIDTVGQELVLRAASSFMVHVAWNLAKRDLWKALRSEFAAVAVVPSR